MKNKRRNHSAQFKVNVALAAAKGQKTIAELSQEYKVSLCQLKSVPGGKAKVYHLI